MELSPACNFSVILMNFVRKTFRTHTIIHLNNSVRVIETQPFFAKMIFHVAIYKCESDFDYKRLLEAILKGVLRPLEKDKFVFTSNLSSICFDFVPTESSWESAVQFRMQ